MKKVATILLLFVSSFCFAHRVIVATEATFTQATSKAVAGDTIVLQKGVWNNVRLKVQCSGTSEKPIVIQAEKTGQVFISGISELRLGGDYLVVDGLYFTNGYAPGEAVVQFRTDNKHIANYCRLTNCVINDFNKPNRLSEDYWLALSGKNNRIDHCSFLNKKNLGVLMAILLDDDRSRENNHSIDHNYFGIRPSLGSNAGEIIRVGVSQHCQFDSKTKIVNNFFEHCDGEVEIISIKSGSNVVCNNVFKECQGDVVLRHGDNNTVESNIFIGNDKEGTGGVRIINRGQWVVNNLFYKCRGVDFRSPLSIMNGVPNSPANRYVQVTDAVIAHNSFYNCTPISFCEGSDAERSMSPDHVFFANNVFFNNRDRLTYHVYDNINGIYFQNNIVSKQSMQILKQGFEKADLQQQQAAGITWASFSTAQQLSDSLLALSKQRLAEPLPLNAGFADSRLLARLMQNAYQDCGAKWFKNQNAVKKVVAVNCSNTADIKKAVAAHTHDKLVIHLTGNTYSFSEPLFLNEVVFTSNQRNISFRSDKVLPFLIKIKNGSSIYFENISLDLQLLQAVSFIETDSSESSKRFGLKINNATIGHFNGSSLLNVVKSSFADSIKIIKSRFKNNKATLFNFANEPDKKGYYNVEKLIISSNTFVNQAGTILQMVRGGNDESTMGPQLAFQNNTLNNCYSANPIIDLYGTQKSIIQHNSFMNCNKQSVLMKFEDIVRAKHYLTANHFTASGTILKNQYVIE